VEEQAREMMQQAPQIPEENYLIEPAPRGTASVVGLAAMVLHKRDPQASMAILPSDHFIRNVDLFHYLLKEAFKVAANGYLVTLGIMPSGPTTAYGYIQQGKPLDGGYKYRGLHRIALQGKNRTNRPCSNCFARVIIPGIAVCSSGASK